MADKSGVVKILFLVVTVIIPIFIVFSMLNDHSNSEKLSIVKSSERMRLSNRTETPWKAVIVEKKTDNGEKFMKFECAGNLISEDLVITAADCVHEMEENFDNDSTKLEIVLGAHNLSDHSENGRKTVTVKEVIMHDDWRSVNFEHNIALIRLNESVEFNEFIQPIAINSTLESKGFGKVSGWRAVDDDGTTATADVAQISELKIMEHSECLKKNENLTESLGQNSFCAENSNHESCFRSKQGSGFYFDIDGVSYLRGIVSVAIDKECSGNEVALITDITKYYDFIEENFNYVKNELKFHQCSYLYSFNYKCSAKFDEFNFDLPVTEIQFNHEDSRISETRIERIGFDENMKKLPKFQKQLFKKSLPNLIAIVMKLNYDKELAKQLPRFLKKFDWIRKFGFGNLLIDENSLNIFDEAKQMEELTLYQCKFPNDHLPARLFSKLTSLTFLEIGSSDDETRSIKTFDENVFSSLTNLVTLRLSYNKIKTLPDNLFQSLTKLEKLYLNQNEIEILPQNLFKNNQNLQTLSLERNKLKEIHVDFRTLPKISLLWLRENDCIDDRFEGTSNIHEKAEYIMNKCKRT